MNRYWQTVQYWIFTGSSILSIHEIINIQYSWNRQYSIFIKSSILNIHEIINTQYSWIGEYSPMYTTLKFLFSPMRTKVFCNIRVGIPFRGNAKTSKPVLRGHSYHLFPPFGYCLGNKSSISGPKKLLNWWKENLNDDRKSMRWCLMFSHLHGNCTSGISVSLELDSSEISKISDNSESIDSSDMIKWCQGM